MGQPVELLSYFRSRLRPHDWTQQELAEFYRVENALGQHGLVVSTDRGVSDEGDPWFVFCRPEDDEVIAHFARIGQQYLVVSSAFSGVARGVDFRTLIQALMEAHPLMLPAPSRSARKIFLHPTALLSALVATAYLVNTEKGGSIDHFSAGDGQKLSSLASLVQQKLAVLSAIAIAVTFAEKQIEYVLNGSDEKVAVLEHDASGENSVHLTLSHVRPESNGQELLQESSLGAHKIDAASLRSFGLEAQDAHHDALNTTGASAASAMIESAKVADFHVTSTPSPLEATNDLAHDWAIALPDMAALVSVSSHASELVNVHQQAVVTVGPISAAIPILKSSNDVLSLSLGSVHSEAVHLVAIDLAASFPQFEHGLPIIVSMSGYSVAQALLQIGYSFDEAQVIGTTLSSDLNLGSAAPSSTASATPLNDAGIGQNPAEIAIAVDPVASPSFAASDSPPGSSLAGALVSYFTAGATAPDAAVPPPSVSLGPAPASASSGAFVADTASAPSVTPASDVASLGPLAPPASATATDFTTGPSTTTASVAPPAVNAPAHSVPAHAIFDAEANQALQSFLQNTPQIAIGSPDGGNNLILMDANPADMQNHDFRVVEWQLDDGSTLTIVGIIPHALIA